MAAEFDRAFPFRGWDKDATPKWQMVPISATNNRYLYLHDGAGLTVTSNNTPVVTVTEIRRTDLPGTWDRLAPRAGDRFFKLVGVSKGNARIQAKNASGATVTEVEVDTKNELTKNVTFYFVSDTAGHKTRRAPAEAGEWVRITNYIYQQCAIKIVSPPATKKPFAGNLGNPVMWSDGSTDGWASLRGIRDPGADHTIFQVWEYEQDTDPTTDTGAGTLASDKITIVDDNTTALHAHVIAHELGHAFGLDDIRTPGSEHHIMWFSGRATGQHLDKSEVNTMNP